MYAVIFEVTPSEAGEARHLELAGALRPHLETLDGFVSVERFRSLSDPPKLLSLSFFRDEAALTAWRRLEAHRDAQREGRSGVFDRYRLRVAQVERDYGLSERTKAPADALDPS